jgi:hypothetical protein
VRRAQRLPQSDCRRSTEAVRQAKQVKTAREASLNITPCRCRLLLYGPFPSAASGASSRCSFRVSPWPQPRAPSHRNDLLFRKPGSLYPSKSPAICAGSLDNFSPRAYHPKGVARGKAIAPRGMFAFGRAARCISSYRRWPSPIPRCNAFWRRAPTERLVSFDIFTTGVRAFE